MIAQIRLSLVILNIIYNSFENDKESCEVQSQSHYFMSKNDPDRH